MLRACVLVWNGYLERHLQLAEFSNNKSFQGSIWMLPYEPLHGRPYQTPLCSTQVGKFNVISPNIVDEEAKKIKKKLKIKMKKAEDRHKSYVDKHQKDLDFAVDNQVYLMMITFNGRSRTSIRGKVDPRYLGPFKIVERVGTFA